MNEFKEMIAKTILGGLSIFLILFILSPFIIGYLGYIRCNIICDCPSESCYKDHRTSYPIDLERHKQWCKQSENCWK